MELAFLSIEELHEKLKSKEISAVELAKYFLERTKKYNGDLNAYLTVTEEQALKEAQRADEIIASGEDISPLLGVPYAVKDLFLTEGVRTTAGSRILDNYIAPYDSTAVRKVKEQHAVMLGKANQDAFGHGSSTENSGYGPSKNPWDTSRIPGGSSGGSSAAIAAGLAAFSLATETGGSIRQPASLCGISGWKPTYGRVSRYGVISMTSSNDSPGVLARTVKDLAFSAEAISGHDPHDSTSGEKPVPSYAANLRSDLKGMRVGVPKEYFIEGMEPDVKARVNEAIEKLAELGAEIVEVSLPLTKYGALIYAVVTPSEISANLSKFDGIRYGHQTKDASNLLEIYMKSRAEGFGDEAKRRIMTGTYALSAGYYDAYYLKAQKVRRLLVNEFEDIFQKVDCLACAVSPNVAIKLGVSANDPLFGFIVDQLNIPASMAGLPALSVPAGFGAVDDGTQMPVGLQIIGPQWGEQNIFNVGHAYQTVTDWHTKYPENFK